MCISDRAHDIHHISMFQPQVIRYSSPLHFPGCPGYCMFTSKELTETSVSIVLPGWVKHQQHYQLNQSLWSKYCLYHHLRLKLGRHGVGLRQGSGHEGGRVGLMGWDQGLESSGLGSRVACAWGAGQGMESLGWGQEAGARVGIKGCA